MPKLSSSTITGFSGLDTSQRATFGDLRRARAANPLGATLWLGLIRRSNAGAKLQANYIKPRAKRAQSIDRLSASACVRRSETRLPFWLIEKALHVRPKNRVHPALVFRALLAKPLQDIAVNA